ncbi:hypothetical protein RB195_020889 [Necator americanus]|uniref:G-protein coupled receptors family 1 profile domain-containing protein n=1 Tax=Necator americanus TaxID=51031 RepID=A0ABR1CNQ3_NECAM
MFELAFIAVCVLILAYIALKVAKSGFFSNLQPVVTESPRYLGKSLTIYYKHHIGAYSGVWTLFKEVRELLPSGATTFGIYYDNPKERDEHLLQSAVGVIFGEDDKLLYTDNYAQQLTRWGYEKMVLPKIERAVEVAQPYTGSLSIFALIYRTYGIIKQFIEDNRLETSIALEFYSNDEIYVSFPLDHVKEFVVPEHLSLEALESKLARKKFDSDEESSESETEQASELEIPEEGEIEDVDDEFFLPLAESKQSEREKKMEQKILMFFEYVRVNASVIDGFDDRINYHIVNTVLGVACTVINFVLLAIFVGYRPFRTRYVLLIQLCVGDLIYSAAVVLTGFQRIRLYSAATHTLTLPVRTTADCASEMWLQLKLIGDLLIPVTIFWMGVERFTAISFPLFYRMNVDGKPLNQRYVLWSRCLVGFLSSHRKATFGEGFSTFLYISNIFCNVFSTTLNAAAYIKARTMTKNVHRAQRHVDIIRYYLLISVLSTVLVSLPNTIALFQVYVKSVSDAISKPSVWMQTINSGIHFFVYLALNREFRRRAFHLLRPNSGKMENSIKYPESHLDGADSTLIHNGKAVAMDVISYPKS